MVNTPTVSVAGLLKAKPETIGLALEVLAGHTGLERTILSPHIQKTGLALAGFHEYLRAGRVLVFGESEVRYIESLPQVARLNALANTFMHDIPCVLITGESGIGKSECALELIGRGHRLVADDAVEVRRRAESVVIGTCPALTRHHMEIRGIGLINVKDLFGVSSTRASKRVELVVQFERWDETREYERLGLDETFFDVLGVPISTVQMPVAPGRNLAILVEVAVRNHLLRSRGQHAARRLADRLDRQLRGEPPADDIDLAEAEED